MWLFGLGSGIPEASIFLKIEVEKKETDKDNTNVYMSMNDNASGESTEGGNTKVFRFVLPRGGLWAET